MLCRFPLPVQEIDGKIFHIVVFCFRMGKILHYERDIVMKKFFAVLLFCSVLLLGLSAGAETVSGQTRDLTWTLDDSGVLRLNGSGKTDSYMNTDTSSAWKPYNDRIRSVVIGDGVTELGWCVFAGCPNLTEVSISGSVTAIGLKAFMDCPNLTSIRIPAGVAQIGKDAFLNCGGFTDGLVLTPGRFSSKSECDLYFSKPGVVLEVSPGSPAQEYAVQNDISYNNGSGIVLCENARLLQKADAVIAECIRDGMTEEQKARVLHDWIVRNASYGGDLHCKAPAASILLGGGGACGDYAAAYSLLLCRAGVANASIWGEVSSGAHMWNLVRIDGRWYHVDVTFDDTSGSSSYFMLTDAQIVRDHSWYGESADNGVIPEGYFDPAR